MKHRQQGFAFILPLVVMAFAAFGLSKSWPVEAQTLPSTPAAAAASSAGWDLSKLPLSKFAHADMQNAAAYATANGYPARAKVWEALDAQVSACEAAINASLPKLPPSGSTIGAATAFEVGAEAVGTGIPAAVIVNCGAITTPHL